MTTESPSPAPNALSRRDQTLARLEKLLSEQFLPPPEEETAEEASPAELVDLEEAVEGGRLPTRPRSARPGARPRANSKNQPSEPVQKHLSFFSALLQALIMIFVLAWVFLLGVMVGREHLWQAGPGHDLVTWLEEKAGWAAKPGPTIVLDPPDPADPLAEPEAAPGTAEAENALPVWNWPPPAEAPPPDNNAAGAEPLAEAEAQPAATADQPDEENYWPPAIEPPPEGGGEAAAGYSPPDDLDGQGPATPATAVPVAEPGQPADLIGEPDGAGKFAVQVAAAFNEDEAQAKVNRLIRQGFNAYYYKADKNGRYPVRVGRFATSQDADAAKVRLEQLGYSGPYVSKISN
ncbi:MAG: SPOR domain-containing protein [Candidatus Adiutrix sp.]|jgi:cell division septation protein DedD|nr:SPOR domain-containing protein [Candidatus Adiutrix sp.]